MFEFGVFLKKISLVIQLVDKITQHLCAMTFHRELRHVEKPIVGQPEVFENYSSDNFFQENHVSEIVCTESLTCEVCLHGCIFVQLVCLSLEISKATRKAIIEKHIFQKPKKWGELG